MSNGELLDSIVESKVALRNTEAGHEIQTSSYSLRFHTDSPYIDLADPQGKLWAQLYKGSDISTDGNPSVTYGFEDSPVSMLPDGSAKVTIVSDTENGPREQVWICRDTFVETYVTAKTEGALQNVRLLGGTTVEPNLFGLSMSQRYFASVYNPQPDESERPVISALESSHITTSGMWKPGRRREFLLTPFSYGFSLSEPTSAGDMPEGPWLMASLSAPIESQNMVEYSYDAVEDGFSLSLAYDSTNERAPIFTSPSLLLHFAPDPLQGLKDLKQHATALGHLQEVPAPITHQWHHGTTFVTWGHQLEQERRQREQGLIVPARNFVTEPFVLDALQTFEEHVISIDKIVLDDKWQAEYGTNTPDITKWPDLPRFTRTQHELGRRVLLWVKLFDPEGLPPELCILDARGRPIASDPTNPEYLELLRNQVHTMLDEDSLGADGLKLDFLAQLPHGPGLRWHGNKRGHAALHGLMKTVYDEARTTKNDALIKAQMVSPWFADTFNQVRLNDTNERHPVVRTMGERARLSLALLPDHSIEPDGWPMHDVYSWLEYVQQQPNLTGSMTTHFVDSVNGEPLTKKEFEILSETAQKVRTSL